MVYIVQNDMHDGDVFKIGQTFRAVEDRVRELDRETGNPGKFKVLASFPVSERHKAEAAYFAELEQQGYPRINESEFVKGPWEKSWQLSRKASRGMT